MISVHEATKIIEGTVQKWRKVNVPLEKALGSVLRQSIVADTDFPPFDRVMMDGIAIRHRDLDAGIRSFKILGVQAAGTPQQSLECAGACLEVMTGAVLPMGADTVVPYEQLKLSEDGKTASLEIAQIDKGRNIHRRGLDKKQGEVLILPGTVMGAPEMAVAASVGASTIWVSHHPTVAIVSTGNELVDIHQTPPPHQIRRSNVYALSAELARIGLKADLYHFNDDKVSLQQNLGEVLEAHDIAIFSGAVSMGKFDFLPEVLVQLGVEKQFHKIAQNPGSLFGLEQWAPQKQYSLFRAIRSLPFYVFTNTCCRG
ncbi:MAG: molybdopterin molybdotransferase MoeA [Cyclobacteriaceae bacterium]|nr:molybdopterin molybdotransferase MoeA [Cyclobacteriaceae bacterium]